MRKRILTVALSIMMVFCISLLAFAEGNGTPPEMPSGDMSLPMPEMASLLKNRMVI